MKADAARVADPRILCNAIKECIRNFTVVFASYLKHG